MSDPPKQLGSPIKLDEVPAYGHDVVDHPPPPRASSPTGPHYFQQFLVNSSSPPYEISYPVLGALNQTSTQETVVDNSLSSGLRRGQECEDNVWSEPAVTNWIPGSPAVYTVLQSARRPRSCYGSVRLHLTENWRGQAELAVKYKGDVLSNSIREELVLRHINTDYGVYGDAWNSSGSAGFSRPSSSEAMVQRLKRRADSLVPDAKRRCTLDPERNSPVVLHTDELLASSALDISDSSLPQRNTRDHHDTEDDASDLNEIPTSDDGSDGLERDPSKYSNKASDIDSNSESNSESNSPLQNSRTGSHDLDATIKYAEDQSTSQSDSSESGLEPLPSESKAHALKHAKEHKLSADEIEALIAAATDRVRREPSPLSPEHRAYGHCCRVDMLKAMLPASSALMEPVRGKLQCSAQCEQAFTTILEFAKHIDEAHPWNFRPFKCPYNKCEWWVLGFVKRSQCLRHIRERHSTLMHECAICKSINRNPYKFHRSDAFRRHLKSLHGKPQ